MNDLLNENALQLMIFILDTLKKATQLKLIGGGVKVKKVNTSRTVNNYL